MRIAVLSDIHGNLTAFEAVTKDLQEASPDLILHGGDLSDSGSSPVEIIDRIRDFGWQGVLGNTDELLFRPASMQEFAQSSKAPPSLFAVIEEMAAATRDALGQERLAWLQTLPGSQSHSGMALLHASPASLWHAPSREAGDAEIQATFATVYAPLIVFGHTHQPYVHAAGGRVYANSGSVGLPYDGDPRASYLLVEDDRPTIRRIIYDVEREVKRLEESKQPHYEWIAAMLRTGRPSPLK